MTLTVLKVYRDYHTANALQSFEIIRYLQACEYPVVSIVPTKEAALYIQLNLQNKCCIAVLYDYINGIEPDVKKNIKKIGEQVGYLHHLMTHYPHKLENRSKSFYIDRFITLLQQVNYPQERIDDLSLYGQQLWNRMNQLPTGFCHGDLHSGNMIQTYDGHYVLFDFDIASQAYSIIDVATLSNSTDFNQLNDSSYDSTLRLLDHFYNGYSIYNNLSNLELTTVFDFIPIRHYELIATITECEDIRSLSNNFLDQQYEWLMNYRDLCERKRN